MYVRVYKLLQALTNKNKLLWLLITPLFLILQTTLSFKISKTLKVIKPLQASILLPIFKLSNVSYKCYFHNERIKKRGSFTASPENQIIISYFLTTLTIASKASALFIAKSARTLRLITTLFFANSPMN